MPPSAFGTSWAMVRALTGKEFDKAQQIDQELTHLVVVPYQPGIEENMQIVHDGRTFQILYIEDLYETKVELAIYCAERGQSA